jgi:hypothetical protein
MKAPKPRMGRPPLGERARLPAFTLRLSEDEKADVYAAAKRDGKPVTQWAREVILSRARNEGTPPASATLP